MISRANRARLVVLAIVAMTGCQSGPRWAFWKHDASPENASLVAHAAPALPSTQSVPQTATAAAPATAAPPSASSIAAATPPSANSLATAGITPASIASPTATPATASPYPNAMPTGGYAGIGTAIPATPPLPATPVAAAPAAAPIAATGPYDPNGYRATGAATLPAAPESTLGSSPEADRYGVIPPSSAAEPDRYTMIPDAPLTASAPPNANMPGRQNYGVTASGDPAASAPQTPSTSIPATIATGNRPDSDRYATGSATSLTTPLTGAPAAATPSAAATVHITAPAGQYRPGGTSTYSGAPPSGIEVASRPAASSATTVSTPSGETAAPSTTPGAAQGVGVGTKTY